MSEARAAYWWNEIDARSWRALWAAGAGWMLDAMDVTLYIIALGAIKTEFHLDNAQAGAVASATLVASALGGVASGVLSDRFGRVRMLMVSVLTYSVFTALTATSQSLAQLVLWRVLVGIGMGGEWSAGAVLVAETWPARHRGKAIGLMQSGWAIGYILAAVLGALILPNWGWRPMFLIGFAPAILTIWIRRSVPEPQAWKAMKTADTPSKNSFSQLVKPPLRNRVIVATATTAALLFSYWGLFTWIPTYLSSDKAGGVGLGVFKSTAWIIPMQIGAFFGYMSFGFLADRFGRKPTFIAFVLGAAAIVPIYGANARSEMTLMILGPIVGFFGHGYFSVFGSMLAELFPSEVRGTAQGFCYNAGRAVSALAPFAIGSLADQRGLGYALGMTSVLYVVGAILMLFLPETRGKGDRLNTATIDLNCDLGECDDAQGNATDMALLDLVYSANIACGGHVGDQRSMERTVAAAMERGVALGAHPGYPDRENFGRLAFELPKQELEDSIATQIDALLGIVTQRGGELVHVKTHGALYHAAMRQREIAEVVARSVTRVGVPIIMVGQSGAPALDVWRAMGFRVAAEAFADRRYESDGSLRARGKENAMIEDSAEAAAQAVRIAKGMGVMTLAGEIVNVRADTLCLHGDTPNAVQNARAVRDSLSREGIRAECLRR